MTSTTLEKARESIPCMFSDSNPDFHNRVGSRNSGFSYRSGIPSSYSSYHGKRVDRLDMNGLGRAITQVKYFNQLGGYYTFDKEICTMIGGYPLGAVLKYKDPDSGLVREVRSLIPDNDFDFVSSPEYIDNVHWHYVDTIPQTDFRPKIFPDFTKKITGQIRLGHEVLVDKDCLFLIQTGCSSTDTTNDDIDYYLYIDVKHKEEDKYFTAGLVCYLPGQSSCFSQGTVSIPMWDDAAKAMAQCYQAWNAPFPLQLYLSEGDYVTLRGNRESDVLAQELYQYWIIPLKH